MTLAIEMSQVSKIYGTGHKRRQALHGLDLTVERGQVFGFIGPNGAGKSTAIKILVGLVMLGGGSARVFGVTCSDPASRRCIGYLPETANYQELLTVRELLLRHASMAGVDAGDRVRRCDEVLSLVGLRDRDQSRIRELSKGMTQRFGLAQALIGEPSLLILDEPTSGLDPIAQRDLKQVLEHLRARGTTVFFSSHQLTDVELICDAVAILHQGQRLAFGPLSSLLETRRTVRVQAVGGGDVREVLARTGEPVIESEGRLSVEVSPESVTPLVDAVRGASGDLVAIEPHRASLEEVYFKLLSEQAVGGATS